MLRQSLECVFFTLKLSRTKAHTYAAWRQLTKSTHTKKSYYSSGYNTHIHNDVPVKVHVSWWLYSPVWRSVQVPNKMEITIFSVLMFVAFSKQFKLQNRSGFFQAVETRWRTLVVHEGGHQIFYSWWDTCAVLTSLECISCVWC